MPWCRFTRRAPLQNKKTHSSGFYGDCKFLGRFTPQRDGQMEDSHQLFCLQGEALFCRVYLWDWWRSRVCNRSKVIGSCWDTVWPIIFSKITESNCHLEIVIGNKQQTTTKDGDWIISYFTHENVILTREGDILIFLWFLNEHMFQQSRQSWGGEVSCHPLWTLTMEVSNTNGLTLIMRC